MATSHGSYDSASLPPLSAKAVRKQAKSKNPVLEIVHLILSPLASLQFTVVLFVLSLFLVFWGTLAQDKVGIWDVVDKYFRSWVVYIPFNIHLPRQWYGDAWEDVNGGFWFCGGKLIGLGLFVNLFSAHAIRFKVQGKGLRLLLGALITLFGGLVATLVIVSGNWAEVQDKPLLSWDVLWIFMIGGVLIGAAVSIGSLFVVSAERFLERILLQLSSLLLTGAVIFMIGLLISGKRLDDSSMRILWQLIQGGVAAGVILLGCVLAFKKRAGIVLLHLGVGLMMVNELVVGRFAVEEQLTVAEGETVAFARDIRTVELSVINREDDELDDVVAVPEKLLVPGETISSEELPFDLLIERLDRNSKLQQKPAPSNEVLLPGHDKQRMEVKDGVGRFYDIQPLQQIAGADASNNVNIAAAYVTIVDKKSKKPLETRLLSQQAYLAGVEEEFEYNDVTYHLGLRHKRDYKPYQVKLNDVSRENYPGTDMPRGYASDFEIIDLEAATTQPVYISMNNPFRFRGETFYQSGYHEDSDGREMTTLQIVTNTGWMIPYVACMFVVVGMLAHFGITLTRFLRRRDSDAPILFGRTVAYVASGQRGVEIWKEQRKRQLAVKAVVLDDANQHGPSAVTRWLTKNGVLLGALFVAMGIAAMLMMRAPKNETPFDLDRAGAIPVVNDGRVLPLDAMSRNTLRLLRERESFLIEPKGDPQPAIRWMLDLMTDQEGVDDYMVFRIEDPELQRMFAAVRRKSKNFSYNEIQANREEFELRFQEVQNTEPDNRTPFQKAVVRLKRKVNTYEAIPRIFQLPSTSTDELNTEEMVGRLELAAFLSKNIDDVPLTVNTTELNAKGELEWKTYYELATKQWLMELGEQFDASNAEELSNAMFEQLVPNEQEFIDVRVNQEIFQSMQAFLAERRPEATAEELEEEALRFMSVMDDQMRAQLRDRFEPSVRASLLENRKQFYDAVITVLGDDWDSEAANPSVTNWTAMLRAYQDDQPKQFDEAVDAQIAYAKANPLADFSQRKIDWEMFYRWSSPLYLCSTLYVFAFIIAAFSWIGSTFNMYKPINRAAFGVLVLVFAIHTFAIVSRMIISGRPPVTNLYSSAVFVPWGVVFFFLLLELIFRMGIGNILASVSGFVILMVAESLSIEEDTFKVVVAVLDTQFWLATHVVCISFGYIATFAAGGLGALYVCLALPLWHGKSPELNKFFGKTIYGMVCFAMFFSFFGTVLGGLWADDSWGRFWGWDPKENGALMIVIWSAIILHARWGAMVKDLGLAILAVLGMIITTWSWFLVNQLGIGLHSYGFEEKLLRGSFIAISIFSLVAIFGIAQVIVKAVTNSNRPNTAV